MAFQPQDDFAIRQALTQGIGNETKSTKKQTPEEILAKLGEAGINNLTADSLRKIISVARPSPFHKISYTDNQKLADVISHHGITHNPELNSLQTAKSWIENKIDTAMNRQKPDPKEIAHWAKYAVDYQDFDNDPDTIDNVVVYNKNDPGDVYAIDGYRMRNRDNDLIQRAFYTTYPKKEDRKANKMTPQFKKYLRKYPTEAARARNPYNQNFLDDYEKKVPLFRRIHQYITKDCIAAGFTTKVDPKNINSANKVSASKYTAILTRLAVAAYNIVLGKLYKSPRSSYRNMDPGYNFDLDPSELKKNKDFMKEMKGIWESLQDHEKLQILSTQKTIKRLVKVAGDAGVEITLQGHLITNIKDPIAIEQNNRKVEKARSKPPPDWPTVHGLSNRAFINKAKEKALTDRAYLRSQAPIKSTWALPQNYAVDGIGKEDANEITIDDMLKPDFVYRRTPAAASTDASSTDW